MTIFDPLTHINCNCLFVFQKCNYFSAKISHSHQSKISSTGTHLLYNYTRTVGSQTNILHISSPTHMQMVWTQPQHTLPINQLSQSLSSDLSSSDTIFKSYRPIGANRSECIGSTGKEMVASNKKHSNIVLAFLLQYRKRKERIYSKFMNTQCVSNTDTHKHFLIKTQASIFVKGS